MNNNLQFYTRHHNSHPRTHIAYIEFLNNDGIEFSLKQELSAPLLLVFPPLFQLFCIQIMCIKLLFFYHNYLNFKCCLDY